MFSKKIIITTALVGTSLALVGTLITANTFAFNISKAAATDKDFTFNQSVGSQVEWNPSSAKPVATGKGSPIYTRLWRVSGDLKDGVRRGESGCFFFSEYSATRTYGFEAGLNNATGFEMNYHLDYQSFRDTDPNSRCSYNVSIDLYVGKNVAKSVPFSVNPTERNQYYTHTWNKTTETERFDKVICTFSISGINSSTEYSALFLHYFKVWWSC